MACDPYSEYCYGSGPEQRCVSNDLRGCGNAECNRLTEQCASAEYDQCCPAEAEVCFKLNNDGSIRLDDLNGLPVDEPQCCHAHERCCNGACCAPSEICEKLPEPQFGWKDADGVALAYGDEEKTCSHVYLTDQAAMLVVTIPLFCILLFLILLGVALKNLYSGGECRRGEGSLDIIIPAFVMVLCAIFMLFSPYWPHAVAVASIALITLFRLEFEGFSIYLWGFFALYFFAFSGATLFGGFSTSGSGVFPAFSNLGNGIENAKVFQDACVDYYGYFQPDPALLKWDADPSQAGYSYFCTYDWVSAISFFAITIQGCFFGLLLNTFFKMMDSMGGHSTK